MGFRESRLEVGQLRTDEAWEGAWEGAWEEGLKENEIFVAK